MKKLIENYANQVWNEKNIDVVEELFTEDSAIHSPLRTLRGASAMQEIIQVWYTAFPDLVVEHQAFVEEGDTVVARWTAKGTHQGPFKGIEPTGLPVSYGGVSIYRFVDGKVVDYWAFVNVDAVVKQLTESAATV